jgi:hypothetical protein
MMADESEVWSGGPYQAPKMSSGFFNAKTIAVGFLVLFIELPLIFIGLLGSWPLAIIGLLLLIVTIYIAYVKNLFKRKSSVAYVITNKRALVLMGSGESQQVLQTCDLAGATCVVHNLVTKSAGSTTARGGGATTITHEQQVGDMVFLRNGVKEVSFEGVGDPNNVKVTADHLIDQLRFQAPPNP